MQPVHELANADLATHPASCLLKDQVLTAHIAVQVACLVDGSQGLASGSARGSSRRHIAAVNPTPSAKPCTDTNLLCGSALHMGHHAALLAVAPLDQSRLQNVQDTAAYSACSG